MDTFEENLEILNDMAASGVDLAVRREIDFAHVFSDAKSANAFSLEVERVGHVANTNANKSDGSIDVIVTVALIPTCESITKFELMFRDLAEKHEGRADGWGFFE